MKVRLHAPVVNRVLGVWTHIVQSQASVLTVRPREDCMNLPLGGVAGVPGHLGWEKVGDVVTGFLTTAPIDL